MIELSENRLMVSFPEVHTDAQCVVQFQRTLRVPDDNQDYPLPAGLGRFPLLPVDDFPVPEKWKRRGGVFLPMYQSEALWMRFTAGRYPFAVKVAAGKINAVTGDAWVNDLAKDPQDYMVLPAQLWLDGFSVSKNVVRQFVATPLGDGYTAEEQITGESEWGGIQMIFFPMKAEIYRALEAERREQESRSMHRVMSCSPPMGLAPGGRIRQQIAKDPYGFDVWDSSASSRCFVHILNSVSYQEVTGHAPPTEPVGADEYRSRGIPWFDYYVQGDVLGGSGKLAGLDSIGSAMLKKGRSLAGNAPIRVPFAVNLSQRGRRISE